MLIERVTVLTWSGVCEPVSITVDVKMAKLGMLGNVVRGGNKVEARQGILGDVVRLGKMVCAAWSKQFACNNH